jgi:hypothetical protein
MPTTGVNFLEVTATTLSGAAVTTQPYLTKMGPKEASTLVEGSGGTILDVVGVDLSMLAAPTVGTPPGVPIHYGTKIGNFAKNGCVLQTLTTTTAQDVDLTDTTANTPAGNAGDTVFATVNVIVFRNLGATDLTVKPGGSNPSNAPKFTGTSPTLAIPAGSTVIWHSAAGVTIDGTHKVFTITPTSGGSLAICIGGA